MTYLKWKFVISLCYISLARIANLAKISISFCNSEVMLQDFCQPKTKIAAC